MKYGALFLLVAAARSADAQPAPEVSPAVGGNYVQPGAVYQPQSPATRVTFVSTSEAQWDVTLDRQPVCSTPCTLGVMPLQYVALRTQERNPIRLDVGYMPAGELTVTAKPMSNGMYATGIVFTAFSGMALATGITLTAVGCATDRDGMCTAGLITGVAGGIGLYGSIYLMRKALPRYTIERAQPYYAGNQVGLAGRF